MDWAGACSFMGMGMGAACMPGSLRPRSPASAPHMRSRETDLTFSTQRYSKAVSDRERQDAALFLLELIQERHDLSWKNGGYVFPISIRFRDAHLVGQDELGQDLYECCEESFVIVLVQCPAERPQGRPSNEYFIT